MNFKHFLLTQKEYFDSLVETVVLLSIPRLYQSIQKANEQIVKQETYSIDDVFGDELTIHS
jgi:PHD/YefM family antitoxin component YafN of YafNO toxin-antitoxin module